MTIEGHHFSVAERTDKKFVGAPIRCRAECACGWVGEWRRDWDEAESDGFAHKAMVVPDPEWDEAA